MTFNVDLRQVRNKGKFFTRRFQKSSDIGGDLSNFDLGNLYVLLETNN